MDDVFYDVLTGLGALAIPYVYVKICCMKDETKQILEIVTKTHEELDDIRSQMATMSTKDDLSKLEHELRNEIRDTKTHLEGVISDNADLFSERTINHESRLAVIENQLGMQPAIPTV